MLLAFLSAHMFASAYSERMFPQDIRAASFQSKTMKLLGVFWRRFVLPEFPAI
jgi:hypothetical protein